MISMVNNCVYKGHTDFKLSLNTSFTPFAVVDLTTVIVIHNINELARQSRMLYVHTQTHSLYYY